jgi:hypothetical protein
MLGGLQKLLRDRKIPSGAKASAGIKERFKLQNDPLSAFVSTKTLPNPSSEIPKTGQVGQGG